MHGLGQCAKEPAVHNWDYVDFLSRDAYVVDQVYITRKVEKVVLNGKATSRVMKPKTSSIKQDKRLARICGIMHYCFIKQMDMWCKGLEIFEAQVARRLSRSIHPSTKREK